MPLPRGSSSLSLVEPGQPSLQEWVDRSLSEAISEARSRGAQVFHVSNLRIDSELSVGVFDSPVEDAFLFGDQSRVMIGVGAVKVLEPGHSTVTDSRTTRNLLGGGTMPTVDISKVTVMGGWGFPSAPGS